MEESRMDALQKRLGNITSCFAKHRARLDGHLGWLVQKAEDEKTAISDNINIAITALKAVEERLRKSVVGAHDEAQQRMTAYTSNVQDRIGAAEKAVCDATGCSDWTSLEDEMNELEEAVENWPKQELFSSRGLVYSIFDDDAMRVRYAAGAMSSAEYIKERQTHRLLIIAGLDGTAATPTARLHNASDSACVVIRPPPNRRTPAVTSANGAVYVSGGCAAPAGRRGKTYSETLHYDAERDEWLQHSNMSEKRTAHALVAYGQVLFAFGGIGCDGAVLCSAECCEVNEKTWSACEPMKLKRAGVGGCATRTRIWAIGGSSSPERNGVLDSCEFLEGDAEIGTATKWQFGPKLNVARMSSAVAACGNRVFLFGGTGKETAYLDSAEYVDDRVGEEPTKWTIVDQAMKAGRQEFSAVYKAGRIFLVGGSGIGAQGSVVETVNLDLSDGKFVNAEAEVNHETRPEPAFGYAASLCTFTVATLLSKES